MSPLQSVVAGTAQSFTVALKDPYGNVATNYAGTVAFTSTDAKAALPAAYTFYGGRRREPHVLDDIQILGQRGADRGRHNQRSTREHTDGRGSVRGKAVGYSFRVASNVTVGTPFTVMCQRSTRLETST